MFTKILDYLPQLIRILIVRTPLKKLLKKLPFLRRFICKAELIDRSLAFDATSFVACASGGQLPDVKLFTCAGIPLNMPGANGDIAIIAASRNGHEKVVYHLLSLPEIDINAKNDVGDTALITAAHEGYGGIVGPLLAQDGIKVNLKNKVRDTALIVAAREGHRNIVAELLRHKDIDLNVNAREKDYESALLAAARRGRLVIAQQLRDKGAEEPELEKKVARWQLKQEDIFNASEFIRSVQNEDVKLVRKFLIAGIDPNTRDESENTALITAAHEDHDEIVGHLLAQDGIIVNHTNRTGDTALIVAAREGHRDIVTRLLQKPDVDVNARNKADESALLAAARRGHQETVQQLQAKGAEEPELGKKVARWQLDKEGIFNDSEYFQSVRNDNVDLFKKFLIAGMDPNTLDETDNTALITAVHKNHDQIVGHLLDHDDTKVNLTNRAGDTALLVAAREGHRDIVTRLLQKPDVDVNARSKADESALLAAARRGHQEIVGQLRDKEAEEPELEKKVARWQLEQEGIFNDSEYFQSVRNDNVDLSKKFLIAGMDPDTRDGSENTALITAAHEGYGGIVGHLLAQDGIKVNLKNKVRDTALIVAAREGHRDIVAKLLQKSGIDVNARNKADESALLEAARRGHQETVRQLRDKEAKEPELDKRVARWQLEQESIYTEIHFVRSVASSSIELTQKYLRAGMNVNAQDDRRETALIVAVRHRDPQMVKLLLLHHKIDANRPNRDVVGAAEMAAARDYTELVELFQEAGAQVDVEKVALRRLQEKGLQFRSDVMITMAAQGQERLVALILDAGMHPNAEDDRGNTALIEASKNGQKPVVEFLIDRGADVNLPNRFNVSALEAAERSGHSQIADLLRANGAKAMEPSKESLLDAVEKGDIERVRVALEQGTSPDAYTERGEPLLIAAIRHKRLDIVKLLLDKGALVDARDRDQKTALMRAAELGASSILHLLLERGDAQLEEIDNDGSTPLMLAIRHAQVDAVQILIEAGANLQARDKSGRTVLMIAKLKEDPTIIKLLEQAGLQEKSLEANLLAAAARGDHSEVENLLKRGAKPEVPDEAGNTSLALAASRGWTKVIEALDPNEILIDKANGDGDTPLMQAARAGHLGTVELLIGRKAGINIVNPGGETALLQAAVAGRGPVVKLLANKGADPNLNTRGTAPLAEACYHGQLEAVEALIDKGADLNQQLAYGFSPLMTAMLAGHEEIEELLRKKEAWLGYLEGQVFQKTRDGDDEGLKARSLDEINLNARDRKGWTALMVASREGFDGVVRILLDAGADPNLRARDGKTTAVLEAASNGRTAVLRLLLSVTPRDQAVATRALVEAAARGYAESVRILAKKESGALINGLPNDRVPLVEAAMRGHLQAVQVLLELKANREEESRDGLTAIMVAQLHGHYKVVELLIESGCQAGLKETSLLVAAGEDKEGKAASEVERLLSQDEPPDLNARDEEGRTALMRACERGHRLVVEALLRYHKNQGAKQAAASDKDYRGRTPLMWAARGGNTQIVLDLLTLQADVDAESDDKRTALMEACKWGWYEIVTVLIDAMRNDDSRRVAVNHQDKYGNTPLGEALLQEVPRRQQEYEGIVKLLEKYGAEFGRNRAEFLHAVRGCNLNKVGKLIDKVDFKKLRLHGKTPLMLCAESDCVDVAGILIDKGVDVNDVGRFGVTALMLAAKNRCRDTLQLLLGKGADFDRVDSQESSALIEATQLGDEDIVSDLINAGANVNQRNSSGNTALTVAVANENPRLVSLLLKSRRKLNLDKLDGERRTALTIAHLRGHRSRLSEQDLPSPGEPVQEDFLQGLTQIERLLFDADARKGWNEAELILAAKLGHLGQIQNLMGNVDVNVRDIDGGTALLIACRGGSPKIAQILIQKGASVEVRDHDERTPLMEAAKKESLELVEQLLQADPTLDLNAQDKQGETALLEAARGGTADIVQSLIDWGANVNAANRRGKTPIIEMARHPSPESVRALLGKGANACARDVDHRTAIIEAARHGHVHILEMLLDHLRDRLGRDIRKRKIVVNAVDHESRTALDWAEQGGFQDCTKLLRQHGGKLVKETNFVVYTTPHGACYHRLKCPAISRSILTQRLLREALRLGYGVCNRPRCGPSLEEIDWIC